MKAIITTTITTMIDLDTFEPDHSVTVDSETDLPEEVVYLAVIGACKATINTCEKNVSSRFRDEKDDE